MRNPLLDDPGLPDALLELVRVLAAQGHGCWLVGESLLAALQGEPPATWSLATSATAPSIAACLPRAFPVRPGALAFAVPSPIGPIDLATLRNGPRIEDDLAHRAFTLLALAWSPLEKQLIDPHGGQSDLAARLLRAVGDASERFAEEPLAALRAARLVAQLDCAVHPALERALRDLPAERLRALPAAALRRELVPLLLAPHAGAGLALLRRVGLETALASGTPGDGAALIDATPRDLGLRLLVWLRGSGAARSLRRLRVPPTVADRVLRLLRHHPIERTVSPDHRAAVARLARRLAPADLRALIRLRERELALDTVSANDARERLAALEEALERHDAERATIERTPALALDGHAVMAHLGGGAGPHVGAALRHLRARVAADPAQNTPPRLRAILDAWSTGTID